MGKAYKDKTPIEFPIDKSTVRDRELKKKVYHKKLPDNAYLKHKLFH